MDERQLEILGDAIITYGENAQLDACIEECAELIEAICDYKRGKYDAVSAVIDETADVLIMATQMAMIFGRGRVDERIKYKVDRLEKRLEGVE